MIFKHVRSATSILQYNGKKILIDPCLAPKNSFRNVPVRIGDTFQVFKKGHPLCDIKTDIDEILECEWILSTHRHFDHFDKRAREILDKKAKLICQPWDYKFFRSAGFNDVQSVDETVNLNDIKLVRVIADHGAFGGKASGYVLSAEREPTIYVAGDTIYSQTVKSTIETHKPDIILINGGGAKVWNSKLIMGLEDIEKTMMVNPKSKFIIVHLDTINHCVVTRTILRNYFTQEKLKELGVKNLYIPNDDEEIIFI